MYVHKSTKLCVNLLVILIIYKKWFVLYFESIYFMRFLHLFPFRVDRPNGT
jgi:hypothetical protein